MDIKDRAKLLKCKDVLLQDLTVGDVLDYLDQESVIDLDDRERISKQVTTKDKARKLLEILPYRGKNAFETFFIALKSSYPHLAQALVEVEISNEDITEATISMERKELDQQLLSEIRKELSLRYDELFTKTDPIPWSEEFVLSLGQVYTKLEILEKDTFNRQFVPNVEEDDLFNYQSKQNLTGSPPRRIYIDGVAGSGKTTLCQKLAYDWSQNKEESSVNHFKLVLLIELHHVSNCESIDDLIYYHLFPSDFKYTREDVIDYIQRNQNRVLIIFDGLATSCENVSLTVGNYLQGKILHQTCCLVTSRPMSIPSKYFDVRLRNKGFPISSRKEYVSKFFSCKEAEFYSSLLQRIHNQIHVRQLTQNPFNLLFICLLWDDNQGMLPKSLTTLFEEIVHAVVKRYCLKYHKEKAAEDLPGMCRRIQSDCETVAFKGILENKSEFTRKDIEGLIDTNFYDSDFLTQLPNRSHLRPSNSFSFTHRNIQEIFAAMHIAKMNKANMCHYFQKFLQHRPTRIVCMFLIGLLRDNVVMLEMLFEILSSFNLQSQEEIVVSASQEGKSQAAMVNYHFNKNMRVYSASFHALNEANNPEMCTDIIAAGAQQDIFLDVKAFQNHYFNSDFRNACYSVLERIPTPRAIMLIELTIFSARDPKEMALIVFSVLTHIAVEEQDKFELFIYCDGLNYHGFASMVFLLECLCEFNCTEGKTYRFLEKRVKSINFLNHCCTLLREMSESEMRTDLKLKHPEGRNLPPIVVFKNVLPCPPKTLFKKYNSKPVVEKTDCCLQKEGDLAAIIFKELNPDLDIDIRVAEIPSDFILDIY